MVKHSFTTDGILRGIKFLEQLFDFHTKTFYDFETFKNLYDIKPEDFLKYYNLIGSIPVRMKNEIKQQLPVNLENMQLLNKIKGIKKAKKLAYKTQLKRNNSLTKAEEKWEILFGQKVNWKSAYTIPYEIVV